LPADGKRSASSGAKGLEKEAGWRKPSRFCFGLLAPQGSGLPKLPWRLAVILNQKSLTLAMLEREF